MLEQLSFRPSDRELLEKVLYAAPLCGRAAAMVVNLHRAGMPEKAELWGLEVDVLQKRCAEATINKMPYFQIVAIEVERLTKEAFQAAVVTSLHNHNRSDLRAA